MGNVSVRASDSVTVLGTITPDALAAGTATSGWVAAKDYGRLLAVIQAGDLGSSATLDAKIEQAQNSGGTGAKDITGKAITQLTQAGTDSDKIALINVRPEELDIENNFTHVRISMTVATATSECGALLLGLDPRYGPGSHIAAVDEVVS